MNEPYAYSKIRILKFLEQRFPEPFCAVEISKILNFDSVAIEKILNQLVSENRVYVAPGTVQYVFSAVRAERESFAGIHKTCLDLVNRVEFLELENKKLQEENEKLKSKIKRFEDMQSWAKTALGVVTKWLD